MDEQLTTIIRYFRDLAAANPELMQPHQPRGWAEGARILFFNDPDQAYKECLDETGFDRLSVGIYRISQDFMRIVVAYYSEDRILWLDNHLNHQDFCKFWTTEQLADWLPSNPVPLANLITLTKLNFLGFPKLVQSVSEIMFIPERRKSYWREQDIQEWHEQLSVLPYQVEPPSIGKADDGRYLLTFFVWTEIVGQLFRVQCLLNGEPPFAYHLEQLAVGVGNYFTPH